MCGNQMRRRIMKHLATKEKPVEAGSYVWWWDFTEDFMPELSNMFSSNIKVVDGELAFQCHPDCIFVPLKLVANRLWLKLPTKEKHFDR
jgi:hypothetical protein